MADTPDQKNPPPGGAEEVDPEGLGEGPSTAGAGVPERAAPSPMIAEDVEEGESYRVVLYGGGVEMWDQTVCQWLGSELGMDLENLQELVDGALQEQPAFMCPTKPGRMRVMVLTHPLKGNKAADIEIMMKWWGLMLGSWRQRGPIGAVVSPASQYDGVVKLLTQITGLESVLVKTNARAAPCHRENRGTAEELRRRAQDYRDRLVRGMGQGSEPDSDPGEESEVQSYTSEPTPNMPMAGRKTDEGGGEDLQKGIQRKIKKQEPPDPVISSEEELNDLQDLPPFVGHPTTPVIRECVKEMDRDLGPLQLGGRPCVVRGGMERKDRSWEEPRLVAEPARKHTSKTERHSSESPPPKEQQDKTEMISPGLKRRRIPPTWPSFSHIEGVAPALNRVPPEAKKVILMNGSLAYSYVGRIAGVSSDALIVFTNAKGEAHHAEVRDQLWEAGEDYRGEVERLDMTQTGIGMVSGGRLPHYAIIHVKIDCYKGSCVTKEYLPVMMEALDRGLGKAKEIAARRVMISVNGLRSGSMPWKVAELAAIATIRMDAARCHMGDRIEEYVIQTAPEDEETRRRQALASTPGMKGLEEITSAGQLTPKSLGLPEEMEPGTSGSQLLSGGIGAPQVRKETRVADLAVSPPRSEIIATSPQVEQPRPSGNLPESDSSEESEGEEEDSELVSQLVSQCSLAEEGRENPKELRRAKRRGQKKPVEFANIKVVTGRMARDLSWGTIKTRDGREAYTPEVGQLRHSPPGEWVEQKERNLTLGVIAPVREWANILMTPSSATLAVCSDLTKDFRVAYLAVTHDVMLRRMKKAALLQVRRLEAERRRVSEISSEEEEEQPEPPMNTAGPGMRKIEVRRESTPTPPKEDHFREIQKINTLVRARGVDEKTAEYLQAIWAQLNSISEDEEAKRLWLCHITGDVAEKGEAVVELYNRIVLEDMRDEESFLAQCRADIAKGSTLTQAWHRIKKMVPSERFVKALRIVTAGQRGEVRFATMPMTGHTMTALDQAVKAWDLETKYYEGRRKKESRTSTKVPENVAVKSGTEQQLAKQNGKASPKRDYQNRMQSSGRPPTAYQPRPPPTRRSEEKPIPSEDYNKLTPEQKEALRAAREAAGGPRK